MDTSRVDAEDLRAVDVAVLAKAPQPGRAKTRLIPALGAERAARLQRRFTLCTLQTVADAQLGGTQLWCTPDIEHRFFRALRQTYQLQCLLQPEGDIGERMHAAFVQHQAVSAAARPMLLVGTDCPALTPAHLREAARRLLQGADAVIAPAEDGGYVLIGLRRAEPRVFEGISWSTSEVMAQTRKQVASLGWHLSEMQTLWDVDRPADLVRLQSSSISDCRR